MSATAVREADRVYDAVAAQLGIDPAAALAELRDAIAAPLPQPGGAR
jgi:hypothetical protein